MELYAMRKDSGILEYCLIERASIPLHITSPSGVYSLIHTLLTFRTAIACTLFKITHHSEEGDSDFSEEEGRTTTMTPENSPY
ncbi:317_t:CDS:2 [Entrophospora sp. SA101]|nr:317_t:CDS:2 [Entrophospora sp. SA101]